MTVLKYDLTLNAREYREITVYSKNSDGTVKPIPTGTTASATIVDYIGGSLFSDFVCQMDHNAGKVTLILTKENADKLQGFTAVGKKHYWNLFFEYPNEKPVKKIEGEVIIKKAAR